MYVITNCFDWIGYHLTDKLLQEGHEVIGIDTIETEKQEQLYLAIGRNSLFQYKTSVQQVKEEGQWTEVRTIYTVKDDLLLDSDHDSCQIVQLTEKRTMNQTDPATRVVFLPLLFGEWMPRDVTGFRYRNQYIRFDSQLFQEQAIYIEDFIHALRQLSLSTTNNQNFYLKPLRTQVTNDDGEQVKSTIYVRESQLLAQRIKSVNDHYLAFQNYYTE